MFCYSPSKGDPSKSSVGEMLGTPSERWNNLRELFDYLLDDIDNNKHKLLLNEFKIIYIESDDAKKKPKKHQIKSKKKLSSIDTAYEVGYKYPNWILEVK